MASSTAFACDMSRMAPGERAAHLECIRTLYGATEVVEEVPTGYHFRFPADALLLVRAAEFIALERVCCPFFGFAIDLEPAAGSFRLLVTGPEGVKPFIQAEFGEALPRNIGFPGASDLRVPA